MSVNTKAILPADIRAFDIMKFIENKFSPTNVRIVSNEGRNENINILAFSVKNGNETENHGFWIFEDYTSNDYEDLGITIDKPVTYINIGHWGKGPEILKTIVETYGGYYLKNDANGEWERILGTGDISPRAVVENALFKHINEHLGEKINLKTADAIVSYLIKYKKEINNIIG